MDRDNDGTNLRSRNLRGAKR